MFPLGKLVTHTAMIAMGLGADAGSAVHRPHPSGFPQRILTADAAEGPRQAPLLLAGEACSDLPEGQSSASSLPLELLVSLGLWACTLTMESQHFWEHQHPAI